MAQEFIAITGQWRPDEPQWGRLPLPYAHSVAAAGGIPRVLSTFPIRDDEPNPEGVEYIDDIDPHDASQLDGAIGLLLPGGGDIDPAWYGKSPHPETKQVSHRRDRFDLTILGAALERDLPILAICHGMQLLNVYMGGTLDQHLADRHRLLQHDRDRPRAEPVHSLRIKAGSVLAEAFGSERAEVNSHHHQGLGNVAPELEEIGWAEDSVLEAVYARQHEWVLGVQWHPEAMTPVDPQQRKLFDLFVDRCGNYAARRGLRAESA